MPDDAGARLLPFEKMQGIGNDFVVLDGRSLAEAPWPALAVQMCDRHFGIGADGILILEDSSRADFRMRMFNPDGTEDDCGNGLRCVARFARCHFWDGSQMTLESLSGVHTVELLDHGPCVSLVRLTMGKPRLAPRDIPMDVAGDSVIDYPIRAGAIDRLFTCLYTGSTHSVVFLDGAVRDDVFLSESPVLEQHPLFPQRTSVLWAWPEGENRFRVRIWERGVGETLGCGTGACAVAVAARLRGLAAGPVVVASRGGDLEIGWEPGEEIQMTGPAATVYRGQWPLHSK
ncbi:MAG: diaminopimelate epimerase [Armatimonadota bacterium]|nr:diaminopimelate epimerase [Armatimonadota bacterium]